jgi:mRNA interferase MazF
VRDSFDQPLARGDIVLAHVPFTDLSTTKLRPAAVAASNAAHDDYLLMFVSSRQNIVAEPGDLPLLPSHPEFYMTGLFAPSILRAGKMITLSSKLIERHIGRLGPLLTSGLNSALIEALNIDNNLSAVATRQDERDRLITVHESEGVAGLSRDLGIS